MIRRLSASAVAVLCVCLTGCIAPQPTPVSGRLSGDQLWSGSVRLTGDVVVPAGVQLRIAPGTRVLFGPAAAGTDRLREHPNFPGSELIVRGSLIAEGSAARPILFAAEDPAAAPGSWGGINLSQARTASFTYCLFRQADSAIHSQESEVFVENCRFEDNRVAIRFHSSAILIENNTIRNNGTGIRFHYGAPVVCRNRLVGNDKAFFITAHPRDYRIEANDIVGSAEFAVVLGEEVPTDVDMGRNYWGVTDPQLLAPQIFDRSRVPYLGRVLLEPLRTEPVAGAGATWSP